MFQHDIQRTGCYNCTSVILTDCINFTYSNWSSCVKGVQTRTIVSRYPERCIARNATLKQNCVSDSNCFDSDGFDTSVLGSVSADGDLYTDGCVGTDRVREFYCGWNIWKMQRVAKSSIKECEDGCSNGACEDQKEKVYSECADDDPLNKMSVKGLVVYLGKNYGDVCEEGGLSVRQYYCADEKIRSSVKRCPEGNMCNNGVC
jgi:hypothetical protein